MVPAAVDIADKYDALMVETGQITPSVASAATSALE
jgi:hypothetical protein